MKASTSFSLSSLISLFHPALLAQEYLCVNFLVICASQVVTMLSVSIVCKDNYFQRY